MVSIAIDGPAGAGKSSICTRLAQELHYLHIDTGALYRAVGLFVLRQNKKPADPTDVLPLLPQIHIDLRFEAGEQRILLNGEDVSEAIRLPEASAAASAVSALPEVRAYLLEQQRSLAQQYNVIMDGRDIGTVVLPQATIKIYLTAAPEERARRRWLEQQQKGIKESYENVLAAVIKRDYDDSHRAAAPLRQAEDAWLCDSTHLDFEGTVQAMLTYIRQRIGEVPCR